METTPTPTEFDLLFTDPIYGFVVAIMIIAIVGCFLLMVYLLKDSQNERDFARRNFEKKHYPKTQKDE